MSTQHQRLSAPQYRTPSPYKDPIVQREGYTTPYLTVAELGGIVAAVSLTSAVIERPIINLSRFSFLASAPGDKATQVFLSDKRAHFFRVLFGTNWFGKGSTPGYAYSFFHSAALLLLFAAMRHALMPTSLPALEDRDRFRDFMPERAAWFSTGFCGGAATGGLLTLFQHPVDVLRASIGQPKPGSSGATFSGAMDVLMTTLRHKPALLKELTKGGSIALSRNMCQYALIFSWFQFWKEDLVGRGTHWLFIGCHIGVCMGTVVAFPFHSMRQIMLTVNAKQRKGMELSARAIFFDLKKRYGMSKIYDGFFSTRPWLKSIPLAFALTAYDVACRRYTETCYPERKVIHSTPQQSLMYLRVPKWVTDGR